MPLPASEVVPLFGHSYLDDLLASEKYAVVMSGTSASPPAYHHEFIVANRFFVPGCIDATVWLNHKKGDEFVGLYRAGKLASGHTPTVMHGAVQGFMFDEILGAAATTMARVVTGNPELAFMTRNLLTQYLRPVMIPNDLVVHARVTNVEGLKDIDKVRDIEILGSLYQLKDWVAYREALARGEAAVEPKPLAKGRAEFAKVDLSSHLKRAQKL